MSKFSERLLQVMAIVVLLWFGWSLAKETIIAQIQANNRADAAEQKLKTVLEQRSLERAGPKQQEKMN